MAAKDLARKRQVQGPGAARGWRSRGVNDEEIEIERRGGKGVR